MEQTMQMTRKVKGLDPLLTIRDVALLAGKPERFMRNLIKSGALRAIKLGGNSWRIQPAEWTRFLEKGATGFRHARPSGGLHPGMRGTDTYYPTGAE